ncbi:hypothetical protein [Streptomyces sp. 15-116A]|uniref:hypothetical protein n=1 Tax=Streptomyces sp. 15-116A TaxID=2259035 RepID=UPI0037D9D65A
MARVAGGGPAFRRGGEAGDRGETRAGDAVAETARRDDADRPTATSSQAACRTPQAALADLGIRLARRVRSV